MTIELLGDCDKCPLKDRPIVYGYGPHGGLAIVGEAPGASEARRGKPFVGDSGILLRETLRALGQDPDEIYFTNAVIRHPPGNKTPTMTPIRACNHRLMEELAQVAPTKILTCGGVALTAVSQAGRVLPVTKLRGRAQWVDVGGHTSLLVPTIHPAAVLRDPNMFPDFMYDLEKWLRVEAPMPDPEVETIICHSRRNVRGMLEMLEAASVVSCDLETYGFNPFSDDLISIGFGAIAEDGAGLSVIVPEGILPLVRGDLWNWMTAPKRNLVFHNAKFDLQFLNRYFDAPLPDETHVGDTMLLHYLVDERPIGRYLGHGLKDLARTRYDVEDYAWDFEAFYATEKSERDYNGLYHYQGLDCYFTIRLFFDLLEEVAAEQRDDGSEWFDPLYVHSQILVPGAQAFALAEYHGTYIDRPFFEHLGQRLEHRLERRLAALKVWASEDAGMADFNPGSPIQVQQLAYEVYRFPGRGDGVDREHLEAMIRQRPRTRAAKVLQHIINWRNDKKVADTYVTGLLEKVDTDGRIRPDFQLAGTATGRLSCRNPNFQNIPAYMAWPVRQGFAAPPGFVFCEADYSQLELRVAAWLSQDPDLIDVFTSGKDIHAEVAVAMFGKPAEEITEKERYMAKRVDFGIMYGRSAKALAEGPEMDYYVDELGGERWSIEQAELYVTRFLEGFLVLREWMKTTADNALKHQWVDTPLGRRRRFPYVTRAMVGHLRRQAVNTPIQGVASDMCLTALNRLSQRLEEFGGHILFAVHDSIAMEIPADKMAVARPIIQYEMSDPDRLPIDAAGLPFPCDIEVGPNWGQLAKEKK